MIYGSRWISPIEGVRQQPMFWHLDGSVQDCIISIANALGILQSCTKQFITSMISPGAHLSIRPAQNALKIGTKMYLIEQNIFQESNEILQNVGISSSHVSKYNMAFL